MTTYRTDKGLTGEAVRLKRDGHTIGILYPNATDDEIATIVGALTDRASDHGNPRET